MSDESQKNLVAARPFLKWAGGKTQLLPELLKRVPASYNTYHEPFLGGGALFWALKPARARLAEANKELVMTYQGIQRCVAGVIRELEVLFAGHCSEQFYRVREEGIVDSAVSRTAARMIYLNRTCFNGLYRVNSKGYFNVSLGKFARPPSFDPDLLRACATVLRSPLPGSRDHLGVSVDCSDVSHSLKQVQRGDFVYLDPPYDPVSKTASFTSFTANRFGKDDQDHLADAMVWLKERGVEVLLSAADTEESVRRYESRCLKVERVPARRRISCKADDRRSVTELLVT